MQPTYLPWLGYFNLIESVETFVFFDDVKLLKRSWHVRNKIIEKYETEKYLTIPVFFENKNLSIIKDAKVDDSQKWRKKHLSSIKFNYKIDFGEFKSLEIIQDIDSSEKIRL